MERDFEGFFKGNEGRIHYQIHRLGISGEWYHDFYAEGLVAMWQAFREYEAGQGNMGTFVNYRIRFRLIDLLRKKLKAEERQVAVSEASQLQLSDGNLHKGSGLPVLDVRGIELADPLFWEAVRKHLSDNQWKWVHYFIIYDLSVKEIMELEGVSADAVKSWGREVRRKLRKKAIKEELENLIC